MAIARYGLRELLPPGVRLVSGPGCPVCVTAMRDLDTVVALCGLPDMTIATFGDLVRVPASRTSLAEARAAGADVRVVYSPLDAVELAAADPTQEVVFVGIGFETTAPTTAAAVVEARQRGVRNFSILALHKTMPLALKALLELGETPIRGFLLPGHVSVITGSECFAFLAADHGVGGVVAGFQPSDILEALLMLVRQGVPAVDNQYTRAVQPQGNPAAQALMDLRRRLARARPDPRVRPAPEGRVRRPRRRGALPGRRGGASRTGRVPLRRRPARRHRPGGVPALRPPLQA
jgi:hydrogenase expression/formation protein HypD